MCMQMSVMHVRVFARALYVIVYVCREGERPNVAT